jgi:tRNA 2-thiouridine synthesizing protein A
MPTSPEIVVDARGHRCPTPTLRLRRALESVAPGEVVALIADDPLARIDVAHFAGQAGHALLECRDEAGALRFRVRKRA